jgi:hypothetical protein
VNMQCGLTHNQIIEAFVLEEPSTAVATAKISLPFIVRTFSHQCLIRTAGVTTATPSQHVCLHVRQLSL